MIGDPKGGVLVRRDLGLGCEGCGCELSFCCLARAIETDNDRCGRLYEGCEDHDG